MIYLSVLALPFGVPMQSRHVLLPWQTPHLSLAFGPPHTAVQSALQSSVELALHLPHLQQEKRKVVVRTRDQQEKEKSWSGLVMSTNMKRRAAGS